jgi:hypothetical protein
VIEPIGSEVLEELRRFGPAVGMADVVRAWPLAVGEGIAQNAWPARLSRDGTLHVTTASSAWAFELSQLAPKLLERLREHAGDATPTALRFAPGNLPETGETPGSRATGEAPSITDEDRARAAELTAGIADADLRALVARAAAASLARQSSDR